MKYIEINFTNAVPMTVQEAKEKGYNLNGYTHDDGMRISRHRPDVPQVRGQMGV